jgi:hypothetical protein
MKHAQKKEKKTPAVKVSQLLQQPIVNAESFQFKDKRPESAIQRNIQSLADETTMYHSSAKLKTIQKKPNTTGMPDKLKSGVEHLSGMDMSDVKVHYNSSHPAQLNAHAYAQGTNIHIAPEQEKYLGHEAWHVVQQKQGRVKPTLQMKRGVAINDDKGLEREADVMGEKALSIVQSKLNRAKHTKDVTQRQVIQRVFSEAQKIELKALTEAPTAPDEKLRKRAQELLVKEADDEERLQVRLLISKFSIVKEKKKDVKAEVPNSKEQERKGVGRVEKSWDWNEDKRDVAVLLHGAQSVLMQRAFQIGQKAEQSAHLAPDPIENILVETTKVPVVSYHTGELAGLGLWTGLLKNLKSSDGKPRIHVICIETIDGKKINIRISEHTSHSSKAPDYFVHDSRAELYMHSASGIQQASPAHNPKLEEQLSAHGDSLTVSYASFAKKIALMKAMNTITDAKIAEWMLMIIMSPSIATAVITRELPKIKAHEISMMYELVATWMLAEPARHQSSMISGIIELENIEGGRKTFDQALSSVGHPMSHIGSEAHGRQAELDEQNVSSGKAKPAPQSQVGIKQKKQLDDTYGSHKKKELIELIEFYTTTVVKSLM